MKRGIIQSRGLGDIVIALPIARYYYDHGDEIVWPICAEFYESFKDSVPWVTWVPIESDPNGFFFLDTPLHVFDQMGVDREEALYLYQYLNTVPERTDPEFFSLLKFDQYKYAIAGVPFKSKWSLGDCITRDPVREAAIVEDLCPKGDYVLVHLEGSSARAQVDLSWLSEQYPAAKVIEITAVTTNIFDWLAAIEGARAVVCLDSVYANLIDQLDIQGPDRYWIRRSGWDLTPVMGGMWTWVPVDLPTADPKRVDPAAQTAAKLQQQRAQQQAHKQHMTSHVPFETDKSAFPTSFMSAVKK